MLGLGDNRAINKIMNQTLHDKSCHKYHRGLMRLAQFIPLIDYSLDSILLFNSQFNLINFLKFYHMDLKHTRQNLIDLLVQILNFRLITNNQLLGFDTHTSRSYTNTRLCTLLLSVQEQLRQIQVINLRLDFSTSSFLCRY